MPYDPYGGGWGIPSWYQRIPTDWYPTEKMSAQTASMVGFLNAILPLMRTQTDMLAIAREIATLTGGTGPFKEYASAKGGATKPPGTPQELWQHGLGSIIHIPPGGSPAVERWNAQMRQWLQGLLGLAKQYQKAPLQAGAPLGTREQTRGFSREIGTALGGGPAGSEAWAPWLMRLFKPTLTRQTPGSYGWNEYNQAWQITKNPRFF